MLKKPQTPQKLLFFWRHFWIVKGSMKCKAAHTSISKLFSGKISHIYGQQLLTNVPKEYLTPENFPFGISNFV